MKDGNDEPTRPMSGAVVTSPFVCRTFLSLPIGASNDIVLISIATKCRVTLEPKTSIIDQGYRKSEIPCCNQLNQQFWCNQLCKRPRFQTISLFVVCRSDWHNVCQKTLEKSEWCCAHWTTILSCLRWLSVVSSTKSLTKRQERREKASY